MWAAGWARIGQREHGVVYRLAGGRWQSLYAGLEETINGNSLLVFSATNAWLAVNPGLAHFNGKSWTMVKQFPGDGSQILSGFAASGPRDIWAVGVDFNVQFGGPLVVHFDGTTWKSYGVPDAQGQLYDVALRRGGPVAVGEEVFTSGDTMINKPYVLELRNGTFVRSPPPRFRPAERRPHRCRDHARRPALDSGRPGLVGSGRTQQLTPYGTATSGRGAGVVRTGLSGTLAIVRMGCGCHTTAVPFRRSGSSARLIAAASANITRCLAKVSGTNGRAKIKCSRRTRRPSRTQWVQVVLRFSRFSSRSVLLLDSTSQTTGASKATDGDRQRPGPRVAAR